MAAYNTPEYLNINQVCSLRGVDRNQIQLAIEKHKLRVWAYIGNKKNPLRGLFNDSNQITLVEEKYTYILPSEIERIGNLSEVELQNEGFTITALNEQGKYLAKKTALSF